MPPILVLGAGVCGLASALMLARDGHDVTVLERDATPPPEGPAFGAWKRPGVPHFGQAHLMQPLGRHVLEAELPDVADAFLAAGAVRANALDHMPPTIADRAPRPGDARFTTITGSRPTFEQALARRAAEEPRVTVRRGVGAATLERRRLDGHIHVTGVRTDAGETLHADLVVDAMGRGSRLPRMLAAAGAVPPQDHAEDSGFLYYTRFFRGPDVPEPRAPRLAPIGSFSLLTIPGDAGTWSVTVYAAATDRALRRLRHPALWTALIRACPAHAHWLDGEPITDVLPMGGVIDRYRDPLWATTGVASVGDASACTNPSLGRGMALGLAHAARLRDVVRAHLDDPRRFAEAWREATERELGTWYRATIAADRARLAEMAAFRAGGRPQPPTDLSGMLRAALLPAMARDADVFRAGLEILGCLAPPQEVFARPGFAERVLALADGARDAPAWGPPREEVLALVA